MLHYYFDLFLVREESPRKQGLRLPQRHREDACVGDVREESPRKQGLRRGSGKLSHLPYVFCPRGKSTKTRIKTGICGSKNIFFTCPRGKSTKTRIKTLFLRIAIPFSCLSPRGKSTKTRIKTCEKLTNWLLIQLSERKVHENKD